MTWLVDLVKEWAPLVALVLLGWMLERVIREAFKRIAKRVDDKIPDDLPMGGGRWLEAEIKKRGLSIRVLAAPSQWEYADAFYPSGRTILLSRATYNKHDASFWAIAAHELGHALLHRHLFFRIPFITGRVLQSSIAHSASALILANILYGSPEINRIAFGMLLVSLAGYVLILLDEALASTIAILMLARDKRVEGRALVGSITLLLAAFMTYLGGFVGQIILVLKRDFVIDKIEQHRHFVPAAPMGGVRFVIAAMISLFLVVAVFVSLRDIVMRRPAANEAERKKHGTRSIVTGSIRALLAFAVVLLVWDQPLGLVFQCAAALALMSSTLVMLVISIPFIIVVVVVGIGLAYVLLLVIGVFARFFGFFGKASTSSSSSKSSTIEPADGPQSLATKTALSEMADAYANNPPWHTYVHRVMECVLQLAFVVVFWLSVISH